MSQDELDQIIAEIQCAIERDLDPTEVEKVAILFRGGVGLHDWDNALNAWSRAYRVHDDFGYLVSVALTRAADAAARESPPCR